MTEDASQEQSVPTPDGESPPGQPAVEDVAGAPEVMVGTGGERPAAGELDTSAAGADPETPPPVLVFETSADAPQQPLESDRQEWVDEVPALTDQVSREVASAEVDVVDDQSSAEPVAEDLVERPGSDGPQTAVADDARDAPGPGWVVVADYQGSGPTRDALEAPGERGLPPTDVAVEAPAADGADDAPPADAADEDVAEEPDDLSLDAIALALGAEPPIPAELRPEAPTEPSVGAEATSAVAAEPAGEASAAAAPSIAVSDDASQGDEWPAVSEDPAEWAPDPDEVAAAQAKSDADEVADFWYPPEIVADAGEPEPPEETNVEENGVEDTGGLGVPETREPVGVSRWSAEEDDDVLGLRGLAAEWRQADDGTSPGASVPNAPTEDVWEEDASVGAWVAGAWVEGAPVADSWVGDERPRGWRRLVAPLAGRWSSMRTGERVNVVLYALTGVSIVAMALELLAGPDSLPTEVSTTPPPVVSTTTVRQSTTITFPTPKAPEEPAPQAGPAAGPERPVQVTPTSPRATTPGPAPTDAPEPEPEPEPTTPPAQTTTPTSPPTSRATTPTSAPGFPEPTPPVLPTFP